MLEIVLDTETTGLKVAEGHRIVEIGMVELEMDEYSRTGRIFHKHINPHMPMPEAAYKVHGLSDEFLRTKPEFKDVADEFLEFIGDKPLVIHNASFDLGFLNRELTSSGHGEIKNPVVDTLDIAREELPELQSRSLDALCLYFDVDKTSRTKHGALLDAELLAEVYLKLTGANDGFLKDLDTAQPHEESGSESSDAMPKSRQTRLQPRLTNEELEAHAAFVATLGDNAIWRRYALPGRN